MSFSARAKKSILWVSALIILSSWAAHRGIAGDSALFGPDDRTQVTSTEYPWRAIGKLSWSEGNTTSFCTATLVSACHILTAAHCVMDESTHQLTSYPISFQGSNGGPTAEASHVWWGTTNPDGDQNQDWAIVKLNQNLGDQLGWFAVDDWQGQDDTVHSNIILAGYSSDLNSGNELAVDEKVSIYHTTANNILMTDADGYHGASGGAFWYWGDGGNNPRIIGEYTRAYDLKFESYSDSAASTGVASAQFLPTLQQAIAQGCN